MRNGVTTVSTISILASVGNKRCIFIKKIPIRIPIPAPPIHIHRKLRAASCQMNCPVATAIIAKRKIINDEASFSKLSPSRMEEYRFGIFTNFKIAPALTASGGETIPPNRKPSASENPGIK